MTETAIPPPKDTWPQARKKTIAWEDVFERPDTGLIAMIEQASTPDGLLRCSKIIIRSLFSRGDDASNRVEFERELNAIMATDKDPGEGYAMEPRKMAISLLMRDIKENRIARADAHAGRLERGKTEADELEERRAVLSETSAIRSDEIRRNIPATAEDAFVMAFSYMIERRLEVLREGVPQTPVDGQPLPFALSEAFAERFGALIIVHFAPAMLRPCHPFVRQAERLAAEEQVDFICAGMEERKNRETIWNAWQKTWEELTVRQEPPKKPAAQGKKGLFGGLKKEKPKPGWMGEVMSLEDWEIEVARIDAANALAKDIWQKITASDEQFQAPTDADNKTLMSLIARTAGSMGKQINAIRQIAEQGGNAAKTFADYQHGKDVDLPLLAAIYQRSDLFLNNGLLKDFMRSFPDTMRRERFGLVSRYFADQI